MIEVEVFELCLFVSLTV